MENTPNEEHSPSADNGLENLPEGERVETKQILDELEGEARGEGKDPKPSPESPDGKKPDEPKPEGEGDAGKKPEGEQPKPVDEKKPESRREAKLMPAWIHEKDKAEWTKTEKELRDALAAAGKAVDPTKDGEGKEAKPEAGAQATLEQEAEEFAKKHGVTTELAKDLLSMIAQRGGQITPEIKSKLEEIDRMRDAAAVETEARKYDADFDRLISPLVKAEYGDDVPPELISDIRGQLKELAYNPDFAKVPYTTLYKGEDRFRDLIAPAKRGAEGARSGSQPESPAPTGDQPDLSKPLPDATVRSLSEKDFETYMGNMEKYEKTQK